MSGARWIPGGLGGDPKSPRSIHMIESHLSGCFHDGKPIVRIGAFVPDDGTEGDVLARVEYQRRWSIRAVKAVIFYGLCRSCESRPDCADRMEQAWIAEVRNRPVGGVQ
jgi:hypothetical protein